MATGFRAVEAVSKRRRNIRIPIGYIVDRTFDQSFRNWQPGLTTTQAAEYLGLTFRGVARLARTGKIKRFNITGQHQYDKKSLDEYKKKRDQNG